MSGDLFDFQADAQSLAEAENFVRMFSAMNATEGAIYAEIVMARYDRLTAVAEAARAIHHQHHTAEGLRPEDPEWAALGVALEALDGAK